MAITRKSELMLRQLAEKGVPIDWDALDAPFNLFITSIATMDVDVTPLIKFSQRVKKMVRESGFQCELDDILIHCIILNPDITLAKDMITWQRRNRAYIVKKNIDFSRWQSAKPSEKTKMVAKCAIESIASIPMKHLAESSKEALVAIVRQAIRTGRAPRTAEGADW